MKTIDCAVRLARRVSSSKPIAAAVLAVLLTQIIGIAQGDRPVFPELIQLPADFGSEGIAVGNGHTFYVGSFAAPRLGGSPSNRRDYRFTRCCAPSISVFARGDGRTGPSEDAVGPQVTRRGDTA